MDTKETMTTYTKIPLHTHSKLLNGATRLRAYFAGVAPMPLSKVKEEITFLYVTLVVGYRFDEDANMKLKFSLDRLSDWAEGETRVSINSLLTYAKRVEQALRKWPTDQLG